MDLPTFINAFQIKSPRVTVKRACELIGVGHSKFYEEVKEGKIPLIKEGTRSSVSVEYIFQRVVGRSSGSEAA